MPAAVAAIVNCTMPRKLMTRRDSAIAISAKVKVHSEFFTALPRKFVETTAYQEKHSARAISGTIILEMLFAVSECATLPSSRKTMAHWSAKQSSATVATERPISTLDSQVSNRQILCTSARGRIERKAQPKT